MCDAFIEFFIENIVEIRKLLKIVLQAETKNYEEKSNNYAAKKVEKSLFLAKNYGKTLIWI